MPRSPKKDLAIEELAKDQRVYGKCNKARSLEPSVFELMTWNVNDDDHRYSKKAKELCKHFGDYNHFKFLINRSGNPFVSEAHDNYRQFEYHMDQEEEEIEENQDDGIEDPVTQGNDFGEQASPVKADERRAPLRHSQSIKRVDKQQIQVENGHQAQNNNQANVENKKLGEKIPAMKSMVQSPSANVLKTNQASREPEKKRQVKVVGLKDSKSNLQTIPERPVTGKITEMNPNEFQNSEEYQYRVALQKMQQQVRAKTSAEKQQENRRADRIKKFQEQTRWLPNTGFQTYYGKPAFENYGFRNTNPSWGGLMYGSYLKSFNINPQRGENHPKFDQVYISSQLAADRVNYDRDHMPRKCKDEYVQSQKEVHELINRLPLTIKQQAPVKKCGSLKKPDLFASKRFMSKTDEELDYEDNQKAFVNQSQAISHRQEMHSPNENPYLVAKNVSAQFAKQRPKTAKVSKGKPGHLVQHEDEQQFIIPVHKKNFDSYDENNVWDLRTMKIGKGTHPAFTNKYIESEMGAQNYPVNVNEGRKITFAASHKNKGQHWQ